MIYFNEKEKILLFIITRTREQEKTASLAEMTFLCSWSYVGFVGEADLASSAGLVPHLFAERIATYAS